MYYLECFRNQAAGWTASGGRSAWYWKYKTGDLGVGRFVIEYDNDFGGPVAVAVPGYTAYYCNWHMDSLDIMADQMCIGAGGHFVTNWSGYILCAGTAILGYDHDSQRLYVTDGWEVEYCSRTWAPSGHQWHWMTLAVQDAGLPDQRVRVWVDGVPYMDRIIPLADILIPYQFTWARFGRQSPMDRLARVFSSDSFILPGAQCIYNLYCTSDGYYHESPVSYSLLDDMPNFDDTDTYGTVYAGTKCSYGYYLPQPVGYASCVFIPTMDNEGRFETGYVNTLTGYWETAPYNYTNISLDRTNTWQPLIKAVTDCRISRLAIDYARPHTPNESWIPSENVGKKLWLPKLARIR